MRADLGQSHELFLQSLLYGLYVPSTADGPICLYMGIQNNDATCATRNRQHKPVPRLAIQVVVYYMEP